MVAAMMLALSACVAPRSGEEQAIARRYGDALYMYAGAACRWQKPKAVSWTNAELREGIHRMAVGNLAEDDSAFYEIYADNEALAEADQASLVLPARVSFTGWIVSCARDPNSAALAKKIKLIVSESKAKQ